MAFIDYTIAEQFRTNVLSLYKQPIVPIATSLLTSGNSLNHPVHHYEVLTRVSTSLSNYGIQSIEDLVKEMEDFGKTSYLDKHVLLNTLQYIQKSMPVEPRPYLFHVNIHPNTLNYFSGDSGGNYQSEREVERILQNISNAISSFKVPHDYICFEITEDSVLINPALVKRATIGIRQMGCKVSLDDFGKKMMNLTTLEQLAPDFVKIDGQYTMRALGEPFDREVINSLVRLSNIVGATTIAEHVETREQVTLMQELGVDYAQGYFFSKPVSMMTNVPTSLWSSI